MYDLDTKAQHERSKNASEKDARATVYAAVKRVLSDGDVVICDAAGGNYIKGWRYQLYCEAKAVRTPSCVVHVGTPVEQARAVNEERLQKRELRRLAASDGEGSFDGKPEQQTSNGQEDVELEEPYERETWENLVFRYEEPNGMTRWDSPLFTVPWEDAEPPYADIWQALIGGPDGERVVVRPNQATVVKPSSGEGYLYNLDKATQEVLAKITEWSKDHEGEGGGIVTIPGKDTGVLNIELPANPIGLPALQRLRRQFISMNRQSAVSSARITESFVAYLNGSFEAL